jgi:hypothetical protein
MGWDMFPRNSLTNISDIPSYMQHSLKTTLYGTCFDRHWSSSGIILKQLAETAVLAFCASNVRYVINFFNSHSGGWSPNWVHSAHWPFTGLLYLPGWLWGWRIWCNKDCQGKPKYSEKTCPSATLSTTNPTWVDPGANPGRRGGKPATKRLSYGAAFDMYFHHTFVFFVVLTVSSYCVVCLDHNITFLTRFFSPFLFISVFSIPG